MTDPMPTVAVPGRSPSTGGQVERRATTIARLARDAFVDAAGAATEHEWLALVGRGNGLLAALAVVLDLDLVDAERVFTTAAGHLPAEMHGPPPAAPAGPDRAQDVRDALDALCDVLGNLEPADFWFRADYDTVNEAMEDACRILQATAGDWRQVHTSPETDPALLKLALTDLRGELDRVRAERDRYRANLAAAVAPARRGGGFPLTYSPACDGGDYPKEARL